MNLFSRDNIRLIRWSCFPLPVIAALIVLSPHSCGVQDTGEKNGNHPDQHQSQTKLLDRGTESAPLIVAIVDSPNLNGESANNKSKSTEKGQDGPGDRFASLMSSLEWWTFVVVYIQSLLLWLTIRQMTQSDERSLRAWVSFKTFSPDMGDGKPVKFFLGLLNHGDTPALRVGFRAFMKIIKRKEIAPNLPPPNSHWPMEKDMATVFPYVEKEGWSNEGIEVTLGDSFSQAQIDEVMNADPKDPEAPVFYAVTEIEYFDSLAEEWRTTKETYYSRTHVDKNAFAFGIVPGGSVTT